MAKNWQSSGSCDGWETSDEANVSMHEDDFGSVVERIFRQMDKEKWVIARLPPPPPIGGITFTLSEFVNLLKESLSHFIDDDEAS